MTLDVFEIPSSAYRLCSRHGGAVLYWRRVRDDYFEAHRAEKVKLPGVGEVDCDLGNTSAWGGGIDIWRRPAKEGAPWQTGLLKIHQDGLTFEDFEVPHWHHDRSSDSRMSARFREDARGSERFMRQILDYDFAHALQGFFIGNNLMCRIATQEVMVPLSDRDSAGMIAMLRSFGESYLDFYISFDDEAGKGIDRNEIDRLLREIGWRPTTKAEEELAYSIMREMEEAGLGSAPLLVSIAGSHHVESG